MAEHVKLEVQRTMSQLASRTDNTRLHTNSQIQTILKPLDLTQRQNVTQKVKDLMEDVTSGDYVAIIKASVKAVLIEEYKEGTTAELSRVLDTIK
jgi:hypothetical protein